MNESKTTQAKMQKLLEELEQDANNNEIEMIAAKADLPTRVSALIAAHQELYPSAQ